MGPLYNHATHTHTPGRPPPPWAKARNATHCSTNLIGKSDVHPLVVLWQMDHAWARLEAMYKRNPGIKPERKPVSSAHTPKRLSSGCSRPPPPATVAAGNADANDGVALATPATPLTWRVVLLLQIPSSKVGFFLHSFGALPGAPTPCDRSLPAPTLNCFSTHCCRNLIRSALECSTKLIQSMFATGLQDTPRRRYIR